MFFELQIKSEVQRVIFHIFFILKKKKKNKLQKHKVKKILILETQILSFF